MRKFLLLTLTILTICTASYGQIKIRLIGGPQQADIKESNSIPGWDTATLPYMKKRTAFHAGIIADIPFKPGSKVFFQPGFVFSSKGRVFDRIYDTLVDPYYRLKATSAVNYIELPLNLGLKLPLGKKVSFVISAGPYLGLFYSGKLTTETTSSSFVVTSDEEKYQTGKGSDKFKTVDLGVNANAGFDFGAITLTGRYTRSLSSTYTAGYDATFKHEVIGATLGITLKSFAEKKSKQVFRDRDKDGFLDNSDECPDVPGTVNGCPDKDNDGIADKNDKCPDKYGPASNGGCPIIVDTDGDGINDDVDKCPTEKGFAKYNGCPAPDADKDGIPDDTDKCPTVFGVARYYGCPVPDTDGDGVNDEDDKCPTVAGTVDNNGCPEIKEEVKTKIDQAAKNVFFDFASSKIKKESYKVLGEVVKILNDDKDLKLAIEGHTDNVGTPERNNIRSQERADAIKAYLISKNISADRLTAAGFGFDHPIATNNTEAGRAKNRRVEMKLSY
ncbi:MAG: OmpA family protein [Sphingobacteriales bacterium]|nr:OmpA family protein [Sphingobacteriales bacterium]MBI3720783.1 OmpA family protein [Sphingobacteriales bacterium]